MPTTLGGLLVFVVALVPGFVHYVQRRRHVPQRQLSPLVETATITTVSVATNLVAVAAFGAVRTISGEHTPDIGRLLEEGAEYVAPRLGYLLGWGTLVLTASVALVMVIAARPGPLGWVAERFTPAIVDVSAWYHVFEEGPPGAAVFVGCDPQGRLVRRRRAGVVQHRG